MKAVIIAPDYEGLGTPGMHPYLNLKSEANSAIYAMKAYKERYGNQINGQWMSVYQSQGGHASLGTADLSEDANYKGAVGANLPQVWVILFLSLRHKQILEISFKKNKPEQLQWVLLLKFMRRINGYVCSLYHSWCDCL